MAVFKKLKGIIGDLFLLGYSGNGLKNNADGVEVRNNGDTASANLVVARPQGANQNTHASTYLDTKERIFDIEWSFDGGSPPAPGTNTGAYGFCHTSGGSYNAGEVYLDNGSALVAVTVYKGHMLTSRLAVAGTVSLIEDGVYLAETSSAPYSWTLKGDGTAGTVGLEQTIEVPFDFTDIGTPVDSTTSIPAGAWIVESSVLVETAFSGGAAPTCAVTVNGTVPTNLQSTSDNKLDKTGTPNQYDVEDRIEVTAGNGGPVRVTLGGTATAGAGRVFVSYVTPLA